MANIRLATLDDITAMLVMAELFWQTTDYKDDFCPEHVLKQLYFCITDSANGIAIVTEVNDTIIGFGCCVIGPLLVNPNVYLATEIAWWLQPEYRKGRVGLHMLSFMENVARERQVKYFNMISMECSMPEQVARIYMSQGYKLNEKLFTKVL